MFKSDCACESFVSACDNVDRWQMSLFKVLSLQLATSHTPCHHAQLQYTDTVLTSPCTALAWISQPTSQLPSGTTALVCLGRNLNIRPPRRHSGSPNHKPTALVCPGWGLST